MGQLSLTKSGRVAGGFLIRHNRLFDGLSEPYPEVMGRLIREPSSHLTCQQHEAHDALNSAHDALNSAHDALNLVLVLVTMYF